MPSRTGTFDIARWRGPALAVSASSLFLAACNSAGQATFTFWDVIWTMVAFFFWFMLIWIFIIDLRATSSGATTCRVAGRRSGSS